VTAIAEFADKAMTAIPEGFQAAWDGIVAIFGGIGQWFADRWNDIVTAFSNVATWFSTMFTNAWNGIVNVFKSIGQWFKDRWNDVVNALSNVATWFGTMFKNAWNGIVNVFSVAGSWFSGIWGGIKAVFSGVVEFFRGIFQGAWNTITSIFSTIPNLVQQHLFKKHGAGSSRCILDWWTNLHGNLLKGILGTFKTVVNGIIGGINRVITIPFNGIMESLMEVKNLNHRREQIDESLPQRMP